MTAGTLGVVAALLLLGGSIFGPGPELPSPCLAPHPGSAVGRAAVASPVANFSAALQRLVDLVAAGGGAILALVWARVAFSWFSNDVTKKVQAKDRARDALVGTLIFGAALSGLVWALAQWILTGA